MDEPSCRTLALLDSHGPQLLRLLYRLTLRHDVAEDLLQELMFRLLKADSFHAAESPLAFASRVAINLAFKWRRQLPGGVPSVSNRTTESAAPTPLQKLIQYEEHERALRALSELSELTQQCLVLRYLQEQTSAEIATHLGKTAAQVRAVCSKGLAELRNRLNVERPRCQVEELR